ncbi:MAG: HNH endonuclease signature motif containing protein [Chloroflexi bacterium]|nr:HNH endonuclease signature motif containing protein [Chloroflexota bacterium]
MLCEYCQTQQRIVGTLEIDHIVPQAAGGETTLDNLCLACKRCNRFKSNFLFGLDPITEEPKPLFNPRNHDWRYHFAWNKSATTVVGLTEIGRATIPRLRMNRSDIVEARRLWVSVGWHPPNLYD